MDSIQEREHYWSRLIAASERLAMTQSIDEVVAVLRETARDVVGANGIAVVIRENDQCFYAAEDAIGPLWAGNRFPLETCISGWAMTHLETVSIPDIRLDDRVPQDAYQPTFVRSLVMAPIGQPDAIGAIGAYWSDVGAYDDAMIGRLEALARAAAIAIQNARLHAAIRESDRQHAIALAAGRMGTWSLDVVNGTLSTSTLCRINFGRDPQEDFPYEALHEAIHPQDRERVRAAIDQSLSTGCDYDIEYRIVTPEGETRWIGIRAQPTFSTEGIPVMLAGVSVDITERRRMEEALRDSASTLEHLVAERTQELVATQEALRQSQKLEAMGQLTGGVAHDFNNLLTPIIGSLDLLQRRGVGGEREQRLINGAIQSADRAKTLVQRLLAFARRQPLSPAAVDIASLLIEMSSLIATTLGPTIDLSLDISEDLPLAHADQIQVEMAVLNLAVNARDAMPQGGRLLISAHADMAGSGHRANITTGQYVHLTVSDNGIGMTEATRLRAIEPFFSTKGIGRGTGLGLSMAHGLAQQLGGSLIISSQQNVGTTVELWLPVSAQIIATMIKPAPQAIASSAGLALVVDDEELVRLSTADMLSELGFRVLEASSGAQALQLVEAHDDITLLVTDHIMPEMTGAELARSVRTQRPALPILIVSGYSDASDLSPDLCKLEKPFRQSDLAAHIAIAMQQRQPRAWAN